ncbi:MAG: glycosyltransferase family 2 protein [Alphaproteobacteria bacterium]|nr:glycosyltransferase family 2 protein [Alphaproteobacteria bacterium]OJV47544.1 MAG: glycosyl transferase [Alphaproteobacteria bacterium 43-37]
MTSNRGISALVVAHNEGHRLASCLACLEFADEIVVVLDRCTDNSAEVAIAFKARVIEGTWPLEGERRQVGLENCRYEWVIEVDADEHVPQALAAQLFELSNETPYSYFPVGINNYVGTHLVKHGWGAHFGTNQTVRFYRKEAKTWGNERVHPSVTFHGLQGPCLQPGFDHYVDDNISDMIQRFDRYTQSRAADLRAKQIPETLGHNLRRIFSRFFKCYVMRKGYKEGKYGLLIATFAALYPLISYLKATLEPSKD